MKYGRVFFMLLMTYSAVSFAEKLPANGCRWYKNDSSGRNYYNDTLTFQRQWGTQNIEKSAATGSIILNETRITATELKGYDGFACGKSVVADLRGGTSLIPDFTPSDYPAASGKVYRTNTPGIGVIFKSKDLWGKESNFFPYSYALKEAIAYMHGTAVGFIFIKTGEIEPGYHTVTGQAQISILGSVFQISKFSVNVFVENCSIPNKGATIKVPMGGVNRQELTSAQASGGRTEKFSIPLTDCATSSNSSNVVNVRFDGVGGSAIIDGSAGILGLDSDSDASGVGLQILKADGATPFPLGIDGAAGAIAPGNMTLDFHARYVKTSDSPQPGSANARAGFTVSYK